MNIFNLHSGIIDDYSHIEYNRLSKTNVAIAAKCSDEKLLLNTKSERELTFSIIQIMHN